MSDISILKQKTKEEIQFQEQKKDLMTGGDGKEPSEEDGALEKDPQEAYGNFKEHSEEYDKALKEADGGEISGIDKLLALNMRTARRLKKGEEKKGGRDYVAETRARLEMRLRWRFCDG